MLRGYGRAHIAGVWSAPYERATPRRPDWRREPHRDHPPTGPSSPGTRRRRPARGPGGDRRRPRRAAAGVLVLVGGVDVLVLDGDALVLGRRPVPRRTPPRAPGPARGGRRGRPRGHDGLRRRGPRRRQPRPRPRRRAARGGGARRRRRRRAPGQQRLALAGVPGAAPPGGGRRVRVRGGGGPVGGHAGDVAARVGGGGRHRAHRGGGVAGRARRRLRAVPDLRQRAVALRAAPRGGRRRLPGPMYADPTEDPRMQR